MRPEPYNADDLAGTEDDACDEGTCLGSIVNCDDGLFCNGVEACDVVTGCVNVAVPCDFSQICKESNDECVDLEGTVVAGSLFRGDDATLADARDVLVEIARQSDGMTLVSRLVTNSQFTLSVPDGEFVGNTLAVILRVGSLNSVRASDLDFQMDIGVNEDRDLTVFYDYFADGATGNNANSGTEASPKQDPQFAANLVFPGDRVFIRAGTYNSDRLPAGTAENTPVLRVDRNGTAARPILFEAFGNDLVILDAQNRQRNAGDIQASFITVSKLTFTNAKLVGARILSNFRTSGANQPTTCPPIFTGTPTGQEVFGSKFVECVAFNNSLAPTGFEAGFQIVGQASDCSIEFCAAYQNGQGIQLREVSSVNCFRAWPEFEDPWPDAPRDCTIRGNLVFDNRLSPENSDGLGGRYPTDCLFIDNVAFGNVDDNYDAVAPSRCIWHGNVAFDSNPEGTVDGDGNGVKISTREGGGNTVRFNISFLNPRGGFDDDDGTSNDYYNNVAYNNGRNGMGIENDVGANNLRNNIAFHDAGFPIIDRDITLSRDCVAARPFAPNPSDFNYIGDGIPPFDPCPPFLPFGDTNSLSFVNIVNGLTAVGNPLFVNPIDSVAELDLGVVDEVRAGTAEIIPGQVQPLVESILNQVRAAFTLQAGSPCIDAGTDVGQPFNGAAPDIGAIESP